MKFQFIVVLSFFFVFACRQIIPYKEDASQVIKILSPQNVKKLEVNRYSDIFQSINVIQLESPDSALIGRVDKILIYNNRIFILDKTERKAVFEFDMNGRFIRGYGHIGQGTGEYNHPNDISIIENELNIWVNDQQKFIVYDLNGNFVKEVRPNTIGTSGVRISKNKFALYLDIGGDVSSSEKFDLQVFDNDTKSTCVAFEKKNTLFSKGISFFSQNGNDFLISPGYSNIIYKIDTTTNVIRKKYTIDLGQYEFPDDFQLEFPTAIKFQNSFARSKYAYISSYWETSDYLIYSFAYQGLGYDVYYSKKTGLLKYGNAWFNNVHGIFAGTNKGVYNDNVIAVYDPSGIDIYQKTLTAPPTEQQADTAASGANKFYGITDEGKKFVPADFRRTKEEINMLKSIKTSDNPIILIAKLKHF